MANALDHRPDLDEPRDTGRSWNDEFNKIADPHSNWAAQVAKQAEEDQAEQQGESGDDNNLDVKNREESAGSSGDIDYEPTKGGGSWRRKQTSSTSRKLAGKLTGSLKGRLGIMGLITTFGLGGGLLVAFFGPASMLINISQNLTLNNDSSSTVLERRLFKVLNSALSADSADLCMSSNKIRCKQGRVGNNVLRKMAKKGIVPVRNGAPMNLGTTGYAKQNPTHFRMERNGRTINVAIKDLPGFLSQPENRDLASKVYGRRGVINMQARAWAGKHITNRFFSKLGINRNGGLVSRAMKSLAANERLQSAKEKLPKLSGSLDRVSTAASEKVSKKISKAGRAGPAYAVAVGACAAVKAPKYIAAGVAAIELLSLVSLVSDITLGPGAAAQMQGIDDRIEFTGEDAGAVGTILTQTTPRESDGKQTSALDSSYLLTALGVSSSKLPLSSFIPGYGALNNPAMKAASAADEALEPGCNVIMNPVTMYTMMGIDAAATVALSATVVGGIIKIAGSWAISAIASAAGGYVVGEAAKIAIRELANTDAIDSATGEKLGDAIGIGATAFFASGAMSRFLPSLSGKSLVAFNDMKREQEQFQKEMDIASLSPFDTSSRYTFLGNIAYNLRMGMISNGNINNSLSSIITNIIKIPATALSFSQIAKADTNISVALCGYAEEFGLNTGDPNTEPAINMAGMPCTGITPEMDSMTTDQAITILSDEGWINEDVDIPEGSTIDDLISIGFIERDTPMTDYIEDCGDPSTGDYLFNAPSCVISDSEGAASDDDINGNAKVRELNQRCEVIGEGEQAQTRCYSEITGDSGSGEASADIPTTRSMSAIITFLIDYQVSSILSGEDDGDEASTEGNQSSDSTAGLPDAVGDIVSPIPEDKQRGVIMTAKYGRYPSGGKHWGIDLSGYGDNGWEFVSVCDGVVDKVDIKSRYANRNAYKVTGSTNYVWVKCDNGIYMGYAHFYANRLKSYIVPGYRITAGTPIAPQGDQGNSSGPHLHFQINPNSTSGYSASSTIDPVPYLERLGVSLPKPNY